MTVNPKSLSTQAAPISASKPTKISKKIDMGAASNFGRDELGINSPTHRNTHAEEDLFGTSNTVASATTNKTDLLDDLFKTCSTTPNNLVSDPVSSQCNKTGDDDFFNPREDESQEFGDFASAFGTSAQTSQKLVVDTGAGGAVIAVEAKKNDFADFNTAFNPNQPTSNSNDPANLLFVINSTPHAQTTTSNSNQKAGDLLSDLDGLTLDVSVPTGELYQKMFQYFQTIYIVFFLFDLHSSCPFPKTANLIEQSKCLKRFHDNS